MGEIITTIETDAGTITERLADYARQADGAFAANTARAVKADTAVFSTWCSERAVPALPAAPYPVAAFVDAMADTRKSATVRRYVASVAHMHRAAGLDDPTKSNVVKLALKRLGRQHGIRQTQAAPIGELAVERVLATTRDRLIDRRDLALLLVARDMLARRSEAIALMVEDVTFADDGSATVLVRRSKTDVAGEGAVLWLSPRAASALKAWIDGAGITEGVLFRAVFKGGVVGGALDAGEVARRFKVLAERAGIDAGAISGLSAGVGMAQDLVARGHGCRAVEVTGYASAVCGAAECRAGGRGAVLRTKGVAGRRGDRGLALPDFPPDGAHGVLAVGRGQCNRVLMEKAVSQGCSVLIT